MVIGASTVWAEPAAIINYVVGNGEEPENGDVDGDGSVNAKDTNIIRKLVGGIVTATELQTIAGDVNGDGVLNGIDANILARYAAGLITEF